MLLLCNQEKQALWYRRQLGSPTEVPNQSDSEHLRTINAEGVGTTSPDALVGLQDHSGPHPPNPWRVGGQRPGCSRFFSCLCGSGASCRDGPHCMVSLGDLSPTVCKTFPLASPVSPAPPCPHRCYMKISLSGAREYEEVKVIDGSGASQCPTTAQTLTKGLSNCSAH